MRRLYEISPQILLVLLGISLGYLARLVFGVPEGPQESDEYRFKVPLEQIMEIERSPEAGS